MKIRNGFVSNSSSSSFIVFGFKAKDVLSKEDLEDREKLYKRNPFGIKNIEFVSDDREGGLVGYVLADVSDCDLQFEDYEVSLDELSAKLEEFTKKYNVAIKPKIYMGTRSC